MATQPNVSDVFNQKNKKFREEIELTTDTIYKSYFDSLPLILANRHKVWSYMFTSIEGKGNNLVGAIGFFKKHPLKKDVEDFFYTQIFLKYFPGKLGLPKMRK
jgi:hypothetical protein